MGSAWDWNEDDIRYLYLECGWTAKAIAEEWGVPYISLNRKIRAMGIGRGQGNYERGPVVDDPVLVANVAQRYVEAGMTVVEIADELSLGRKKVANVLSRSDVARRLPAHLGGARDQSGSHNNNWRGGPGVRPCDAKKTRGKPWSDPTSDPLGDVQDWIASLEEAYDKAWEEWHDRNDQR